MKEKDGEKRSKEGEKGRKDCRRGKKMETRGKTEYLGMEGKNQQLCRIYTPEQN